MSPLARRVSVAVAGVLLTAGVTTMAVPKQVERAAILAGLVVLTPEMEGTRLTAYPDTGGVWTICTGHTGGVRRGDRATSSQCEAYLRSDLGTVLTFLEERVTGDVSLLCKVAIADFAYNVGITAAGRSTLLRHANAGDQVAAAEQFGRWVYVGGKDCRVAANNCGGIVGRRNIQSELCRVSL